MDYAFVLLTLLAARPLAMAISLFPSELSWREWVAAAWFGPKGFASVLYALIILRSGIAGAEHIFHLAAVVIALSMFLHSSTDVPMVQWFKRHEADLGPEATEPNSPEGQEPHGG